MTKVNVGQRAVLGFERASKLENAGSWARDADYRCEVSEQDYPKDKKFKDVPSIHASEGWIAGAFSSTCENEPNGLG